MVEQLLYALMSQDNIRRREAESMLSTQLETDFINVMRSLMSVFCNLSSDLVMRSFAGILIRSSIEKYSTKVTNIEFFNELKSFLLNLWSTETNQIIFLRLSHILAQLSIVSKWNDLIPILINGSTNNTNYLLHLIEIISDYSPECIQNNLNSLGGYLGQHIMNSDAKIQINCARATCACIVCLDDENHRNLFRSALAPIMNILCQCLSTGNETDATSIIDHLVTIANIQPVFYKGSVDNIVNAMLSIANSQGLEFTTRTIAIELIVTLTETAPALARRCEGLASGLCPIAFSLMLEHDETENEWISQKYTEEPVEGDYIVGEEIIERIAAGMGGQIVTPEVLKLIEVYSNNMSSWKHRRSAVAALHR